MLPNETKPVLIPGDTPAFKQLSAFGGFDLLESAIEGVQNLNPSRKARRELFLGDSALYHDRQRLKQVLEIWEEILSEGVTVADIQAICQAQAEERAALLQQNLGMALQLSRPLEQSYRNLGLFFANAGALQIKNLTLLNAAPGQLRDLDNTRFTDVIRQELVQHYDRLDLRQHYSLLVIPGYAGSNAVLERWARMAYESKVMLISDFTRLDAADDVMEMFTAAELTGAEEFRANAIMTCNWLMGRGKYEEVGEAEDLFVPPSGALAGKIYGTLMSQVTAGKKFGALADVQGVSFPLKKSEIACLEQVGLIPVVKEYGRVMAFSARTLFNGDNLGLQTYSVVRVFDYVTKVLMDFLNRRAFENFSANTRKDLQRQIIQFLDSITGPERLIEDFEIRRFEQDMHQKDRIHLDIFLKPYFPARTFLIKMDGQKGISNNEWETAYEQTK
ncbi:type VI secretion system contractile sheath protein TssC [Chitinophaga sp. Cy-1792]|uniref:type VI secretion system contractile sheath protein TssC n=1 Tax=Chitinophaga sp. Cy-1792 TaxID=2608339 RepID=UPI001422182E|nr:type VI secretion system contractile sheath protein TssC [Chitinophaga sp. Cy-1792]NIG53726.1 type VI secretion system contractile sheath protein TssC [Chitinophaga sp. Cy-1792]